MKNKLSAKEQKILDDSFATLEGCINNLAKNERLSLDNIHKAIHYTYELFSGTRSLVIIGKPHEGKSRFSDFMNFVIQNEQPATIWSDVEDEVGDDIEGGGRKEIE